MMIHPKNKDGLVLSFRNNDWQLLILLICLFFGLPDIYQYTINTQNAHVWKEIHGNTLPETNIAPENRPLEKDIPIGNHQF